MRPTPVILRLSLFALLIPACNGDLAIPVENPDAMVSVAGTYDYRGAAPNSLIGTITFEQEDELVRLVNTTYANAGDRPLIGEAMLSGNRLDITLVPENGDQDYSADITFLFSEDGNVFTVAFTDTNGDAGLMGSYHGTRRPG